MHTGVIAAEEFEFVENFKNFEITIPATIPVWLWGGQVSFRKHSCLRLKFLNPEMMTEEERELKERKEKLEREKEEMYKKRKNSKRRKRKATKITIFLLLLFSCRFAG